MHTLAIWGSECCFRQLLSSCTLSRQLVTASGVQYSHVEHVWERRSCRAANAMLCMFATYRQRLAQESLDTRLLELKMSRRTSDESQIAEKALSAARDYEKVRSVRRGTTITTIEEEYSLLV